MKRLQIAIQLFFFLFFITPSFATSAVGTGNTYYSGNVNFVYNVDTYGLTMLYDEGRNILTLNGKNLIENANGSYNYIYVDSYQSLYSVWNIPLVQTITISSSTDMWWRMESSDITPEFFIILKDASGKTLYRSYCVIGLFSL